MSTRNTKSAFKKTEAGPSSPKEKEAVRSEAASSPTPKVSRDTSVEKTSSPSEAAMPEIPIVRNASEQAPSEITVARPSGSSLTSYLSPFIGYHINYQSRQGLNSYLPCSFMMDHIIHTINYNLVDNFYFKRHALDYHPYILRLYYGVIFWIQCLRAGYTVSALTPAQHQFLSRFLDAYPPSSLPIVGPLIPLFKTLCSSDPTYPTYGPVYPRLPTTPGPERREQFSRNAIGWSILPNIPGIFALLEHLNGVINDAEHPRYPKKSGHTPVTATAPAATVFGHHSFPVLATRTDQEKWSLVSSGLQYSCEADSKLNEAFAERFPQFMFPVTAAADNLTALDAFMSMNDDLSWFTKVKDVALSAALFFEGSGTLADCSPAGCAANQIVVELKAPKKLPAAPTKSSDEASLFPFHFRLSTNARGLTHLEEVMAAMAQTNVRMFSTHPRLSGLNATLLQGEFWDIRPIERSPVNTSSYLAVSDIIKKMMKTKMA